MRNTPGENAGQEAERRAEEAAEEVSPWVERIARFGYATKGVVYVVVGMLAVGVATGIGGRATDPPGAFQTISTQPFGRIILGFVALGLAGYALWRLVQAVADPEGEAATQAASLAASGTEQPRWATLFLRSPLGS